MILDIQDIINAVSVPALIKDEFIKGGIFERTKNGEAQACVGGFSVVFPVEVNGTKWAFRCWHNTLDDAQARIKLLSSELKQSKLPYFVDFTYEDSGILVNGRSYPTTRMKWINGHDLKEFICQNKHDRGKLIHLADRFFAMTQDLHKKGIAHGDLQHENIIVNISGRIFLIDYDSMYVPAFSELKAKNTTNGKDGYQHPAREHCVFASEKLDYFSEIVILISILAVAFNPNLADKYQFKDSDSLLFRKSDFLDLTNKEVYRDIIALGEPFDVLLKVLLNYLKQSDIEYLEPIDISINKVSPLNAICLSELLSNLEDELNNKEKKIEAEKDDELWKTACLQNTHESYLNYIRLYANGRHTADAKEKAREVELFEWNKAQESNTVASYTLFRNNCPKSELVREANNRIELIVEEDDWKIARLSNTYASYKDYLRKHPYSKYSRDATEKRDYLLRIETESKEWNNALTFNTIIAFKNFISSFPNSVHVREADERILRIRDDNAWNKTKKADDKESYAGYISKFPYGRHVKEAQEKLDAIIKKSQSNTTIIILAIIACVILVLLIIHSISSTPTPTPVPNEQLIQEQIITNEIVLSPDAIRELERSTKEKLEWLKTAKDCGDVMDSRLKSEADANLKKLEKAGSSKYSSLKKLYDDLQK